MKKLYTIILFVFIGAIANAQYSKLLDFAGTTNGSYPYGDLISDGTYFYGMTEYGGTNGSGVIFKVKPDGTDYVKLLDFTGFSNGSFPKGSLVFDGTYLYGMTFGGGANSYGTLFKIKPDGSNYSKLIDFTGTANGSKPYGSLFSDGTFLYGMTEYGGTNDEGTLFKVKHDGTGYIKLLDFTGTTNGSYPLGNLIFDGNFLYGMTQNGGTSDLGTIFKIMPDGTGYSKLLDFSGTANGSYPYGDLISDGTYLYGMTSGGGTNTYGTIFKIQSDGTGYSKLFDFDGTTNGRLPGSSLISDGSFLYGMTLLGGSSTCGLFGCGVIFKIKHDGTEYSKLLDFSGTNGQYPYGSLISDGTYLYGMTEYGGTTNMGIIFKYNLLCTDDTITQTPTICAGENITVGSNTYTTTGFYYDTLTSFYGCDSIITTNLTVLTEITDSVTIVPATCGNSNGSISVTPLGGSGSYTFLWSNGDTTSTITGLSGQPSDTLIVSIMDTNGCTLTDTAIINCIISTGIHQIAISDVQFTIYPNPSNGEMLVTCSNTIDEINISDVLGQIVYSAKPNEKNLSLQIDKAGVYFVAVTSKKKTASQKLVVRY